MKLITKFISIIIALSVLMSVTVLPVSATVMTSFPKLSLKDKSEFYVDDVFQYKYVTVIFCNNCYYFHFYGDFDEEYAEMYLDASSYYDTYIVNADGDRVALPSIHLTYRPDTDNYNLSRYTANNKLIVGVYGFSGSVDSYVDNIIYSDLNVKYNGMTVYYTSDNTDFSIDGLFSTFDGSSEIVGPQKVPTDYQLYGQYMDKNEETWSAFIQWLIDTEQYTELAMYGLTATADNIQSLANTWWNNKFSPTLFFNLVKTNGVNTLKNAENIMSWFNTKWQKYINHNYVNVPVGFDSVDVHHRAGLTTDKTDDEGNITDSDEVSILREILRQIINLPVSIASNTFGMFYSLIDNIATNTYAIASSLNVLPQQLANMIYNNFVDPLDAIIQAIQSKDNDININHNVDYNTTFQDVQYTLRNKFAFYHQLTEVKTILETTEFSEEKPFLTLAGYQLDFELFDQNREMIHKIIVTLAYLNFFLNLLRSLPVYIGGI